MLYLSYLGEAKKINTGNELKLLIVRKPVGKIPAGFIHLPHLSPSLELFEKTQVWKKNVFNSYELKTLESLGINPKDLNAWWSLYIRDFKNEMLYRVDMIKALNKIEKALKNNENIWLFCYCKDVKLCHRYLVGKYFENKGYQVDYRYLIEKESIDQLSMF